MAGQGRSDRQSAGVRTEIGDVDVERVEVVGDLAAKFSSFSFSWAGPHLGEARPLVSAEVASMKKWTVLNMMRTMIQARSKKTVKVLNMKKTVKVLNMKKTVKVLNMKKTLTVPREMTSMSTVPSMRLRPQPQLTMTRGSSRRAMKTPEPQNTGSPKGLNAAG